MSLTITLADDLAERLRAQAVAHKLPVQQWALMILAAAIEHPRDGPPWKQLNRRRLELIQRKYQVGLEKAEERELAALQALADKHLEALDRPRLEWLTPYEELAKKLSQRSHE